MRVLAMTIALTILTGACTHGTPASQTDESSTSAPSSSRTDATTTPSPPRTESADPATTPPDVDPTDNEILVLLQSIRIVEETNVDYDVTMFGYPGPVDGLGCDTRDLVLIRESITLAQVDSVGCAVVAGDWRSLYDGLTTDQPGDLQVDHVVALKEAWDSGASEWPAAQLTAYANDLVDERTLRAVTTSSNQSKGSSDPTEWLPPDLAARCEYLADWVSVKARWGLSIDRREYDAVANAAASCADLAVAPIGPPPVGSIIPFASVPLGTTGVADVYYANCDEARQAGAAPIRQGEPGYRRALDGDEDGTACDSGT